MRFLPTVALTQPGSHYILPGIINRTFRDQLNPWIAFDCTVNKFAWTKIVLRSLQNTKNTCYTEVTRGSENLILIFNTSSIKNQQFRNQKLDFVRSSSHFVRDRFGSIAELNWTQSNSIELNLTQSTQFMDWVRCRSIEVDWNTVRLGSIDYGRVFKNTHLFNYHLTWKVLETKLNFNLHELLSTSTQIMSNVTRMAEWLRRWT